MITWLHHASDPLPDTSAALPEGSDAPGLLAGGGELTPERLTEAYRKGVFPWFSRGEPILWWSLAPRMVLPVADFKISRSLRKTLLRFSRTATCEIRIDHAFARVIKACAQTPREGRTSSWIVDEMIEAYNRWHRLGGVHSFETWVDGELVGGLYGVCLGRMFYGESMFARSTDASKIALAALVAFCREHHMPLIDCQQQTAHLESLGAKAWPREQFEAALTTQIEQEPVQDWVYHPAMWRHLELGGA